MIKETRVVGMVSPSSRELLLGCAETGNETSPSEPKFIQELGDISSLLPYWLDTGILCFNGKRVDMREKSKIRQLFEIFLNSYPKPVERKEILEKVYNHVETHEAGVSRRLAHSHKHNVLKLLSRSRIFASQNFDTQIKGYDVLWFPHDHYMKSWPIMALRKSRPETSTDSIQGLG